MIVGTGNSETWGLTGHLETQVRVDVAILTVKSVRQASRIEIQAGISCYSLEAVFLSPWEP